MELNIAELITSNSTHFPTREAVVHGNQRVTYAELVQSALRLARYLGDNGLGCHIERNQLEGHQSGQDLMGQLLHNGVAYIEGLLGAYRGRIAPFNINYRYVGDELVYLLNDAAPKAIQFHAAFAPVLADVLPQVPSVKVLLQVADSSGNALLPGAIDYNEALGSVPAEVVVQPSPDDLYVLYTGGTTGMPKGVLWRQADIAVAALGQRDRGTGAEWKAPEDRVRILRKVPLRILCCAPFMHGAAQWGVLQTLCDANTVVIPESAAQFDPESVLDTIESERVTNVSIVGDAFARPLIAALDTKARDLSSLRSIVSGGAALRPEYKEQLSRRIQGLRILDAIGASETGMQGQTNDTDVQTANGPAFSPDPSSLVVSDAKDLRLEPGHPGVGWLARRGRIPLGYLGDEAKTNESFPIVDGERLSVPGDRARLLVDGLIQLIGRESMTINSGGEKIFVEEVEAAVRTNPLVADVIVCARASERWGQEVVAIVSTSDEAALSEEQIQATCRQHIAAYKIPKRVIFIREVARGPNGKADYRWAREIAERDTHGR